MDDSAEDSAPLGTTPPGVVHVYQKYDPRLVPPPSQPPADLVSPAFEHMLRHGTGRKFTEEELAEVGLIQRHESDDTHKGSIFDENGNRLEELTAIYNLNFLYWVARAIGVTKQTVCMGRGSQAQELVGFIDEIISDLNVGN